MSMRVHFTAPARFVTWVFCACLVACGSVAAAGLSVGNGAGPAGGVVDIPVHLIPEADAVAFQFDVLFPAGTLSVTSVSDGPTLFLSDHEVHWHLVAAGRARVLVFSRTNAILPQGVVATLGVAIHADATQSTVPLSVMGEEFVDATASVLSVEAASSGQVSITACFQGDVSPAGVGDATLNLADFVHALRTLTAGEPHSRFEVCGGLAPGSLACDAGSPRGWCPAANAADSFDLEDALVLRQLVAGTMRLSCDACPSAVELAFDDVMVPGDVDENGMVDVRDVIILLRTAVGAVSSTPRQALLGNVVPYTDRGEFYEVHGLPADPTEDDIDVSDVIVVLRLAVGAETVKWKQRRLAVNLPSPQRFVAFQASLTGVPAWAEAPTMESTVCTGSSGDGIDVAASIWAVTCVSDPTEYSDVSGDLAVLAYRAPQELQVAEVTVHSQLVDTTLSVSTDALGLVRR